MCVREASELLSFTHDPTQQDYSIRNLGVPHVLTYFSSRQWRLPPPHFFLIIIIKHRLAFPYAKLLSVRSQNTIHHPNLYPKVAAKSGVGLFPMYDKIKKGNEGVGFARLCTPYGSDYDFQLEVGDERRGLIEKVKLQIRCTVRTSYIVILVR